MHKAIKVINLVILFLFIEMNASSQYFVKSGGDSISFEIDSVILATDNTAGDLNWESSKDSLTWESINQTSESLVIRIDSSAYYRAVLNSGNCANLNSDVALVSFKSVNVTGNSVTIDPTGCIYILSSGIKLIVPPGAVNKNVTFSLDLLDIDQANLKIPLDVFAGRAFCAGLYFEPTVTEFLKPIRIRVPAINYQNVDIPYVYLYNSSTNSWTQYLETLTCSENEQYIEFSTDTLSSARMELIKDVFGFAISPLKTKGVNIDCHELLVEVKTRAQDYMGKLESGECQVAKEQLSVKFTACPGEPEGTALIQEIGEECVPLVEDDMAENIRCLKNGETATITVAVTIGGLRLEGQKINFQSIPYGLSMNKTSDLTDDTGTAQFTVSCNVDDFAGTIYYNVEYKYLSSLIYASAEGESETIKGDEKTGTIYHDYHINACPQVTAIVLEQPTNYFLHVGDSIQLSSICRPAQCKNLNYSVTEGPGAVTVDGKFIAQSAGIAHIKAKSGDIESNEILISVAYEGTINISKLGDDNHYCQCPWEDIDGYHYWIMSFIGQFHISFWLNIYNYKEIEAELNYVETVQYNITSSYCKDTTWTKTWPAAYITTVYIYDANGNFRTGTTEDVLNGLPFELSFLDLKYILSMDCKMTSSEIDVSIPNFKPEDCVTVVSGAGVLR